MNGWDVLVVLACVAAVVVGWWAGTEVVQRFVDGDRGADVSGPGLPDGARIVRVDSSTSCLISTRFSGGHRKPGAWWFRVRGYGWWWQDTRMHPPLHSKRERVGRFRWQIRMGRYWTGPMLP